MFKRKPISPSSKPEDSLDVIDRKIWDVLTYVRIALFALIIYLIVLSMSEMIFTWDTISNNRVFHNPNIKGGTKKLWQSPKIEIKGVGVDLKNFGFKEQTVILRSFAAVANVIDKSQAQE